MSKTNSTLQNMNDKIKAIGVNPPPKQPRPMPPPCPPSSGNMFDKPYQSSRQPNDAALKAALNASQTVLEKERKRAEAWKAIAESLYKSTMCNCCDEGGSGCDDCFQTIQAFSALKRSDP